MDFAGERNAFLCMTLAYTRCRLSSRTLALTANPVDLPPPASPAVARRVAINTPP
jgi:hypothetical protein